MYLKVFTSLLDQGPEHVGNVGQVLFPVKFVPRINEFFQGFFHLYPTLFLFVIATLDVGIHKIPAELFQIGSAMKILGHGNFYFTFTAWIKSYFEQFSE